MSFKRFDPEDIVLSSELVTFPTWYTQEGGDTDFLTRESVVSGSEQGKSTEYYIDYYSGYDRGDVPPSGSETGSGEVVYDPDHSKPLFSLTFARRPDGGFVSSSVYQSGSSEGVRPSYVVYGQYRSLVLGDEYQEFTFGSTIIGNVTDEEDPEKLAASSFIAMSIDRSRFREKIDPDTCEIIFSVPDSENQLTLVPDTTGNRRYLDAGRVFDLAKLVTEVDQSGSVTTHIEYPETRDGIRTSYGYFLPDIGIVLFNTSNDGELFGVPVESIEDSSDSRTVIEKFFEVFEAMRLRSQETVTSNFVFVRARNGEFNYSTNPSNIVGSAGNIRHNIMINQPQSFITTVGLYNDANELLAVAKLSRPLVKDFTKEALIRIKLDY